MDLKQGIEILQSNVTFRAILATLLAVGNFLNGAEVSCQFIESSLNNLLTLSKFQSRLKASK